MQLAIYKMGFACLFSFLTTFYLVPLFCALAYKFNFVDVPDGSIKKHNSATPYMGGVAVYCGFLFGIAFTMPIENKIFLLLVGTMLLLFTGLVDDLLTLKPYQKFFFQSVVALCFVKAGFYLKQHFFYNIWNMPLSFIWMLTVINAFNLIDVMDGLATVVALSATITLLIIAAYLQHVAVMILLLAFLGSLVAFLWYNKPPARIYLGDAGALFIGGFLGAVPFLFDWGTYNPLGYLMPIVILAIPLLECVSLVVIRWYKKIPFYYGSPDHFSCYLQNNGWSKQAILTYMLILSAYLGIVALLFTRGLMPLSSLIACGMLFLLVWFSVLHSFFAFLVS